MNFSISIKNVSTSSKEIFLEGFIDENSEFPSEVDFSAVDKLYINFEKVGFINSGGIKVWVYFCESLEKFPDLKVFLKKCPAKILEQINKTKGFLPKNAKVISAYVPIFCNSCERTFEVFQDMTYLIHDSADLFEKVADPACGSFPRCRNKWERDYCEHSLFKFLEKENNE